VRGRKGGEAPSLWPKRFFGLPRLNAPFGKILKKKGESAKITRIAAEKEKKKAKGGSFSLLT